MNWQEELINKTNELKIEGELYDRISSRNSSRNDNRSSNSTRNSISSKNRKDINNNAGKEEQIMITREAALDDLKKYADEAQDDVSKTIIKVGVVLVKLLTTIRSNQLLTDADKVAIKQAREARKSEPRKEQ